MLLEMVMWCWKRGASGAPRIDVMALYIAAYCSSLTGAHGSLWV